MPKKSQYTIGFGKDENCYPEEQVAGALPTEVVAAAIASGDSWDAFFFSADWHSYDEFRHVYGTPETVNELELPDGSHEPISLSYAPPEALSDKAHQGFSHFSTNYEKVYGGWNNWQRYTITTGEAFQTENVLPVYDGNLVVGYRLKTRKAEKDFSIENEERVASEGKGFTSKLLYKGAEVSIEAIRESLESKSVDLLDDDAVLSNLTDACEELLSEEDELQVPEVGLYNLVSAGLDFSGCVFTPYPANNQFKVEALADGTRVNSKIDIFEDDSIIHIVHFNAKRGKIPANKAPSVAKNVCDLNSTLIAGAFGLWNWNESGYYLTYREIIHLSDTGVPDVASLLDARLSSSFEVFADHFDALLPTAQ